MSRPRPVAWIALFFVWFAAAPACAAPGPETPVTTVPFHLVGSTIVLPVHVAQSDSLWFVLDTGAGHGSVNLARAQALGLEFGGQSQAQGAAGRVESRQLKPYEVRIGSVALAIEHGSSFPLEGMPPRMGHVVDGIVGSELFFRYVVEIDYPHSTLRLYEPKHFKYQGTGERMPLTYTINLPYTQAALDLSDGRRLEGRFVLDTGSSQAVILLPPFAEKERVAATLSKTVDMVGLAVGGETPTRIGRLAALEMGKLRLERPLVSISTGGPAYFAAEGNAGNIGGAVFKKFRCTWDYSRDQLILDTAGDLADPVPFDASGLVLVTAGAAFDTIKVSRIIPESPAAEAGLQPGDRLLSVDGKPVTDLGVVKIRERLRRQGDTVELAVSRGERTWKVPLALRPLL